MGRERGMLRQGTVGLHGSNIPRPALDANALDTLDSNLEADFEYLADLASITIPDPRPPDRIAGALSILGRCVA